MLHPADQADLAQEDAQSMSMRREKIKCIRLRERIPKMRARKDAVVHVLTKKTQARQDEMTQITKSKFLPKS